jgi:hypothetical protein
VSDPKRAFALAFTAACKAEDFEAAEIHVGHAMDELYRLYELAKKSPSRADRAARDEALVKIDKGEIAGAVIWARKFRTHDSMQLRQAVEAVEVSQAADRYGSYYTNLYGVLVWRPRSDFTTDDDNGRGWHLFYDTHLEDRPVLETLQQAAKALGDLVFAMKRLRVSVLPQVRPTAGSTGVSRPVLLALASAVALVPERGPLRVRWYWPHAPAPAPGRAGRGPWRPSGSAGRGPAGGGSGLHRHGSLDRDQARTLVAAAGADTGARALRTAAVVRLLCTTLRGLMRPAPPTSLTGPGGQGPDGVVGSGRAQFSQQSGDGRRVVEASVVAGRGPTGSGPRRRLGSLSTARSPR